MHSVELLVDDATDRAVRANWSRLTRAHLPSQGRHQGSSNRPHLTLALSATMPDAVRQRLVGLATSLPVPLSVGALLVFGSGRSVLSRLVVPNVALLDLQRRVLDGLDEPVDRHGTFRAGAWTPHITLGRRFAEDQLAAAVTVLGSVRTVDGAAVGMRVWDIDHHREDHLLPGPDTGSAPRGEG